VIESDHPEPDEQRSDVAPQRLQPVVRSEIVREAVAIGVATGAYGISFGAVSLAAGLDVWQTMALSVLMFTGASQFGLVGVIAGGGSPLAGAATAIMLGVRNALYGLRMSELLQVRGLRRLGAAQLVIDESVAMAIGRSDRQESRLGFYATGLSVFTLWNLGTLIGALGASWLSDPRILGLDAAVPAAFLALLAPRVRDRESLAVALAAALVAVLAVPFVPVGIPVLIAALVGVVAGVWPRSAEGRRAPDGVS
jgi:predicted branched-subunit amino acid permease